MNLREARISVLSTVNFGGIRRRAVARGPPDIPLETGVHTTWAKIRGLGATNELLMRVAPAGGPAIAPEEARLRYSGVFWLSAALLSLATLLSVRADPSVARAAGAPAASAGTSVSFGSNRSRSPLQLLLLHVPRSGGRSLECTFDGQKFDNVAFKSTQRQVSASFDRNVSLCCGGHSTLSSLLRRFGNATRPLQVSCAKRSVCGRVRGLARFAQADAPPLAAPAMPERRYVTIMRHPVGRIVSAFYHSVSNHNAEHVRASGELRNRFRR